MYGTILIWNHPYIMSAEGLGEWGQKMIILAAVQYCISAGIMCGSKKSKNVVT